MDTMEKISDSDYRALKIERAVGIFSVAIFIFLVLTFILYKVIGFDEIVENMYYGRSFGFLNNLIKYQQTKPVDHYITLANVLFTRAIFWSLCFLAFVSLLVYYRDLKVEKVERAVGIFSIAIFIFLVLAFILYKVIGFDEIIENMYFGRSVGFLNNLIKYQQTKSVDHYIALANFLFIRAFFWSSYFLAFVSLLVRSVVFKKPPHPIWIFLFGTAVILGINLVNPNNRMYSSHGFMHAGIVYEILNGHIPPNNPLLAELPLYWPWGHHFLAAVFAKTFNISPPWAFCLVNILSLLGIVFIINKISRMFIDSPKANILSVFVTFFAISMAHSKGVPIFKNFSNISGMPIGMCFYLLFIYAILRIFRPSSKWRCSLITLFLAVAGVGFLYFQMLPGLLASFGVFFVFRVVQFLKNRNHDDARKIVFTAITVFLGTLLILPYVLLISVDAKGKIDILVPSFVWSNFKTFLLISLPMLTIICVNIRRIKVRLNRQPLLDFSFLTLGVLLTYITLHFPAGNEYKFLSQSMTLFGIIGGIVLSFYGGRRSQIIVILLVLLLGCNLFKHSNLVLNKHLKVPRLQESGSKIVEIGEESEIYEWLLNNTSPETVIIDSEIKVPYLAQRPLYAAKDVMIDDKIKYRPGYGIPMLLLFTSSSAYDEKMIDYRYGIIDKIYGSETPTTDKELDEFFLENPEILIIFRDQETQGLSSIGKLSLVFESSNSNYKIYRPR